MCPDVIEEKRLASIDFGLLTGHREFHPSPAAWEDQVFYFLLLDRFSDGNERGYKDNDGNAVTKGATPVFQSGDAENAVQTEEDAERWRAAGAEWVGGTLNGLASKLGYLKRLGVTAVWISPIFKQVPSARTYHGYGVQNFLDVDPHFGTRQDLRQMVEAAHRNGIYVILDILLNHAGDVFAYDPDRYPTKNEETGECFMDPRWDGNTYRVKGYRDKNGDPDIPFAPVELTTHPNAWPDGAIWPAELQDQSVFTQKGRISNWNYEPEYLEGDFADFKDMHLGQGPMDDYRPSQALLSLCKVYKSWIAFTDCDGFRVDTVKHMDKGAMRFFTSVIHEFAATIGKENFYLIGEIAGGRRNAFETLELTGLNAALGIDDINDKLEWMVKGYRDPSEYFSLFRNSELVRKESHVWFRNKVVTLFDDHDQLRKGRLKARFSADGVGRKLALTVLAINVTTMGIPCIYYGSEQGFDGRGGDDRYIREAMFGGEFGAFRSRRRHFFDEENYIYRELGKILHERETRIVLRRGRQYLRKISGDGLNFDLPHLIGGEMRSVVAWSRIFDDREIILAVNTDPDNPRSAWVAIEDGPIAEDSLLRCAYSTDEEDIGKQIRVVMRNGKLIRVEVPAAGFVIYEQAMSE